MPCCKWSKPNATHLKLAKKLKGESHMYESKSKSEMKSKSKSETKSGLKSKLKSKAHGVQASPCLDGGPDSPG